MTTTAPAEPPEENALEKALRLAAHDAAARPDFFKTLLESPVFVLSDSDKKEAPSGLRTIAAGETLTIQNWLRSDGSPAIPFFSSLTALQRAIETPTPYMAMAARAFFDLTRGAILVLNPGSDFGKEFFPNEIEALLQSGVSRLAERRMTVEPTQVLLGQPATYPTAMVAALKKFLASRKTVKAAYLALMHDRSRDARPHLVVGIEGDDITELLIGEIGSVAGDFVSAEDGVDIVRVTAGETGLGEYFLKSVQPFYEQNSLGILQSVIGKRRA